MSVTGSSHFHNDWHRDATKYYNLLLNLNEFMEAIKRDPYEDIDALLRNLLPYLTKVTDTHKAFAARQLKTLNGGKPEIEITGAHPDKHLIGVRFTSTLLAQVFDSNQPPIVIDESADSNPLLIPGLEELEATSALVVLLQAGSLQRAVGVYNKCHPQSGPFLVPDRQSFRHMVDLVALGVRIGEHRRAELEQVQRAVAVLNGVPRLADLLPQITEQAAHLFLPDPFKAAGAIGLALRDKKEQVYRFSKASIGLNVDYIHQRVIHDSAIDKKVTQNGGSLPFTIDFQRDELGDSAAARAEGLCTALVVPLDAGQDLLGLLVIYSRYQARRFSAYEIEMVRVFASQVATILKKVNAHEDTLREIERLQFLLTASRHIVNIHPAQQERSAVMKEVLNCDLDIGLLYPYNPFTRQFDDPPMVVTRSGPQPSVENQSEPVLRQLIRDTDHDRLFTAEPAARRFFPHWDKSIKAGGYVVLKCEGKTVGLLFVYSRVRAGFSPNQRDRIIELSSRLARNIYQSLTLQAIVDNLRRAMDCDVVILRPYNAAEGKLDPSVVSGHVNKPELLGKSEHSPLEDHVLKLDKPHFTNDSPTDAILNGPFVEREKIRASGCIRLEVDQQPMGILFVNWREPHEWQLQETQAVELFANQAAIAIWNNRLYQQIERSSRHWQALYDVGTTITANFTAERNKVLDTMLKQTIEMITPISGPKAHLGAIQLYNAEQNTLTLASGYPPEVFNLLAPGIKVRRSLDPTQVPGQRIGITGRVVLTRKAQLVPNVSKHPDYVEFHSATRSELAVPLLEGDTVWGVLSIESDVEKAFDAQDQVALEAIAKLTMIAVNNAWQRDELKRRVRQLEAVLYAGKMIAQAGLDTEQIHKAILEQAASVTGAYFATMQWVSETDSETSETDERWLRFVATYPDDLFEKLCEDVGEMPVNGPGITARAVRENDAQLVPDVNKDSEFKPFKPFGEKTQSELAVVFRPSEEGLAVGVLNVEHEQAGYLTDDHREILIGLSNLAMVAKHNAEQTAKLYNSNIIAVMGAWGADSTYEIIPHIGNIRRAVQLLRDSEQLTDRSVKLLNAIDSSADDLRIPPFPDQLPSDDLLTADDAPVFDRVVHAQIESFRRKGSGIQFEFDSHSEGKYARMHHQWLRRVLRHFISNAQRAIEERLVIDPDPPGKIIVHSKANEDFIEVWIEDNGKGVRKEIAESLFVIPIAHSGDRANDRPGRGLLLVRHVVEQYDGKAYLPREQPAQGARFIFTVPVVERPLVQDEESPEATEKLPTVSEPLTPTTPFAPFKPRILMVFNPPENMRNLKELLESHEYQVRLVKKVEGDLVQRARQEASTFCPHVTIMDLRLRDEYRDEYSGLELAEDLPSARHILYTGCSPRDIERKRKQPEIQIKVIGPDEAPQVLLDSVASAIQNTCAVVRDTIDLTKIKWPDGWESAAVMCALFGEDKRIDIAQDVIHQLFSDKQSIELELLRDRAAREPRPRSHHSVVMKARLDWKGVRFVKLAPAGQLQREVKNYQLFVGEASLGTNFFTRLEQNPVYFWELGGAAYSFLGRVDGAPLESFGDFYATTNEIEKILVPLQQFFGETWRPHYRLAKAPRGKNLFDFYNNHYDPDADDLLTRLQNPRRFPENGPTLVFTENGWSQTLPNPVLWVLANRASSVVEPIGITVTHGDLHGSNLFVDGQNAWVIDFERTGWGHRLRDFVQLEIDVVTRLVTREQVDMRTRLGLYRAMVALASVGETLPPSQEIRANPAALKAFIFVQELRKLAASITYYTNVNEYLWGLLLHTLFVGSLSSLDATHREHCMLLGAVIVERLKMVNSG